MPDSAPDSTVSIGQLARDTGSTLRAIRWYVERGLLEPRTSGSGKRAQFAADAPRAVRTIRALQESGMALADIKQLLDTMVNTPTTRKRLTIALRQSAARCRAAVAQREQHLRSIRLSLDKLLEQTKGCDTCNAQGAQQDCAGCGNLDTLRKLGQTG